jgi:hypothetical protein
VLLDAIIQILAGLVAHFRLGYIELYM